VNWIVKWYGKYRRKVSWIVKRYRNYGRKVSWIWKLNQWDDIIQFPEQQQQPYTLTSEQQQLQQQPYTFIPEQQQQQQRWNSTQSTLQTKTKRNTIWKYHTLTLFMTKLQQVNKLVIKMLTKHEN
jgi:hypothetical protein